MDKESQFDTHSNWYELWMQQSRQFFEITEKNLKDLFTENTLANPEEHLKQIYQWLEMLKKQWEFSQLSEEQKAYHLYWMMISRMYNEALDMTVNRWINRSRENNPVKNVRELYDLWLTCCHEVYQQSLMTKTYQEAYGEFMNATFKFWQSALSK
ncbi:poly(R)-hydroxyalkanoic acid synthase subunit PhaE [Aquicella lusitana]|uniref:Poly(3-hydroxyalkanoate) polymerase subunit PhaE n=1 Tax=Aquicella lusitana TaxID=254246 RepID=A0A370GA55_9COXI|nr:poly(R)-hydroxyalkanoic acid synthase subunit PhaE [Aquicella lusitana]RDI40080.1 poly(hydroxyalkanoate) synthase III subunit E [Aquicella lusitana]VVC72360.1 hypothetical protein AQULUS_00700 [Aquicella lusitana]